MSGVLKRHRGRAGVAASEAPLAAVVFHGIGAAGLIAVPQNLLPGAAGKSGLASVKEWFINEIMNR
jgi:hypothetical protein